MLMHEWKVLNSDGDVLKKLYTSSMYGKVNIESAHNKLVALYGVNSVFVELKFVGEVNKD